MRGHLSCKIFEKVEKEKFIYKIFCEKFLNFSMKSVLTLHSSRGKVCCFIMGQWSHKVDGEYCIMCAVVVPGYLILGKKKLNFSWGM